MLSKSISAYSGPWQDEIAVSNPETEQSATSMNRIGEDTAQMTRTSTKIMVKFTTTLTAGPAAVTVSDSTSQWGEGNSYQPTISKTATGTYTITYATEYEDALVGTEGNEGVEETEQVSFRFIWGTALLTGGPSVAHVRCTSVDNVITAYVFDAAGALSDMSGAAIVQVFAR
jgi:hypothetical protein